MCSRVMSSSHGNISQNSRIPSELLQASARLMIAQGKGPGLRCDGTLLCLLHSIACGPRCEKAYCPAVLQSDCPPPVVHPGIARLLQRSTAGVQRNRRRPIVAYKLHASMTLSFTDAVNSGKGTAVKDQTFAARKHSSSSQKQQSRQLASGKDIDDSPELQEVQNLPFESAKLKAEHFHWSERCSNGIQQMLTRRQHRHDAALQAYLITRSAVLHASHALDFLHMRMR